MLERLTDTLNFQAQALVLRDCIAPQADGSYIVSGDSGRDYEASVQYACKKFHWFYYTNVNNSIE